MGDLCGGAVCLGGLCPSPFVTLEFELPWVMPSNNVLLRMHWAVRRTRLKGVLTDVLALARPRGHWPCPPTTRVRVSIVRVSPKLLDRDNLYGGTKFLLDALTRAALIRDDSEQWADVIVTQARGPAHTTVKLEIA